MTASNHPTQDHATYAGRTSPPSDSHRARYLLNRLVTCGYWGGSYTIAAKNHYGCYRRKAQGKQQCCNSRTITRDKFQSRVLGRLRCGLMTTSFARLLVAEVKQLMAQSPDDTTAARVKIKGHLSKTENTNKRLPQRLMGNEASRSHIEGPKTQDSENDALQADLVETVAPQPLISPIKAELETIM